VLSAWAPGGALAEVMRVRRDALAATVMPGPAPFAWHDGEAVSALFAAHGFSVALHERRLAFTAGSARAFLETELRVHPGWIAAREVLEPHGQMPRVRDRALEIFESANEDAAAFRASSGYVVITAIPR